MELTGLHRVTISFARAKQRPKSRLPGQVDKLTVDAGFDCGRQFSRSARPMELGSLHSVRGGVSKSPSSPHLFASEACVTITVRCPICRKMFTTPDSAEGTTSKCSYCREPFTIRRHTQEDSAWEKVSGPSDDEIAFEQLQASGPSQKSTVAKSEPKNTANKFPQLEPALEAINLAAFKARKSAVAIAWFLPFVASFGAASEAFTVHRGQDSAGGAIALGLFFGFLYGAVIGQILVAVFSVLASIAKAACEVARVIVEVEKNTRK